MHKLFTTGLLALLALAPAPLGASPMPNQDTDLKDSGLNVNHRYIIEKIDVLPEKRASRLSAPLQTEIDQMTGKNLDHSILERIRDKIKEELRVPDVDIRIAKGQMPERVVVTFEIGREGKSFDMDVGRFLYHSKQGWTGEGGATIRIHGNALRFGLVSDGDRLAERYAGIQASFERRSLGTERAGLRFRFLSYHQQWNNATLLAASPAEIYRTRQHFIPEMTLSLAGPLDWDFGIDFARLQAATPNPVALAPGARTVSSNAAVSTLRYRQRWGTDSGPDSHELTASYGVRSATGILESDAIFTRQLADARYRYKHGHNTVKIGFQAGRITGAAPLYERFILGNAETLRGWNKFDYRPVGGSRLLHGSIDYSYHGFLIFYDTGALWDVPPDREQKQSLGVGFAGGEFEMTVAFPIRTGAGNPVFYVGVNF
jgi:hypothetical protein